MYMFSIYIHILYIYDRVRIIYNYAVYDTYMIVYVFICTYMSFNEQYFTLTAAVYVCISTSRCQYMTEYERIFELNTCIYISSI